MDKQQYIYEAAKLIDEITVLEVELASDLQDLEAPGIAGDLACEKLNDAVMSLRRAAELIQKINC